MNMPIEYVNITEQLKKMVFLYESGKNWNTEFYNRLEAKYPKIVEDIEFEMGTEKE